MASILNVAYYILHLKGEMTTMKLEKLCYYCQAWSLAWDDVPLFDEDFEAWANGPVCPELFETHRGLFIINESSLKNYSDFNFTENQIETIKEVLNYYGDKNPTWLSNLTHQEEPWKMARLKAQVPTGGRCNEVITKDSMQEYYGGL